MEMKLMFYHPLSIYLYKHYLDSLPNILHCLPKEGIVKELVVVLFKLIHCSLSESSVFCNVRCNPSFLPKPNYSTYVCEHNTLTQIELEVSKMNHICRLWEEIWSELSRTEVIATPPLKVLSNSLSTPSPS